MLAIAIWQQQSCRFCKPYSQVAGGARRWQGGQGEGVGEEGAGVRISDESGCSPAVTAGCRRHAVDGNLYLEAHRSSPGSISHCRALHRTRARCKRVGHLQVPTRLVLTDPRPRIAPACLAERLTPLSRVDRPAQGQRRQWQSRRPSPPRPAVKSRHCTARQAPRCRHGGRAGAGAALPGP